MTYLTICTPCSYGHCDECQESSPAPEGMCGGWVCKCRHTKEERQAAVDKGIGDILLGLFKADSRV